MKKIWSFPILAAVTLSACAVNARSQEKPAACIICHEYLGGELAKPVGEWKGSVHQQNGIMCSLCHGGDPEVDLRNIRQLTSRQLADRQSRAMAKSHGFIGKPSGKALFEVCGRCHSASVGRYASSIMGIAYLADKGGPSCTACHGAHRNTIPEVPRVCMGCHNDTTGFDQIDAMNVTASTIEELSRIRIKLAEGKARGREPALLPEFPEDLGSFQIGFVAFGAVIIVFLIGCLVYVVLEKKR